MKNLNSGPLRREFTNAVISIISRMSVNSTLRPATSFDSISPQNIADVVLSQSSLIYPSNNAFARGFQFLSVLLCYAPYF